MHHLPVISNNQRNPKFKLFSALFEVCAPK